MRIRTAKAADIQFILKLSDQINRQHHQGAPNVFSSPDKIGLTAPKPIG